MAASVANALETPSVADLGRFHCFGAARPVYEVLRCGERCADDNGDMLIRVVESGEEVRYAVTKIMAGPKVAG